MAYPHINEAAPATRTLIPALPSDPVELQTSKALVQNPTSDVLGTDSLDLHLSSEQMMGMSRSIVSIFELDEEPLDEDVEMVGEDEEDAEVDLADQQRRTDRLKGVLPVLAQLWWSASEQIDVVAEKLADGSRDRKSYHVCSSELVQRSVLSLQCGVICVNLVLHIISQPFLPCLPLPFLPQSYAICITC